MTRLFIRFYLGVLFILIMALFIQAFVLRGRSDAENIQVIEESLGGGARLARAQLESVPTNQRVTVLHQLQQNFGYPIEIVARNQLPDSVKARMDAGDDVIFYGQDDGLYLLATVFDDRAGLRFGSLPTFAGPNQTELMTGLGLVLLLAAGAIALLLRPVAKQFRLIERTATEIAGGDFSARVEERDVTSATTLARAFNDMASRTELLLRTQRELLQAVSHELRTPLSRIHFAIDLIRTADTEEQRNHRLQSLETAAEDLDELVGELLRYVRLEANEPALQLSGVELLPIVKTIIDKHFPLHPATMFTISDQLKNGNFIVRADMSALERAIGNLVANAARYGKSRVIIDATVSPDGMTITVDDDGPGIPEADRERAFEPFVRLDDSGRGVGLGLALVRRIVAHHGGRATVLSSPIGGCRVQTVWPAENSD